MSRIRRTFDALPRGERALIVYLMAGDPDVRRSRGYVLAALRGGADVVEIGVPFSDPVADGPTIQRAGVRALAGGTTPADALALVADVRSQTEKPLVLMTYYNPVWKRGLDKFAAEAREAGADGVILPDVPLEESGPAQKAFAAHGLDLIQLASPATPMTRVERLAGATSGFLYLVSAYGTTGARAGAVSEETIKLVAEAKRAVARRAPLCVGFGVSSAEQVRDLAEAGADGVIVGSAIVSMVERGAAPAEVEAFVRELKGATRGGLHP